MLAVAPLAARGTAAQSATPAVSGPAYTAADVRFMQGMIAHHAQALVMAAMVPTHTSRGAMHLLAQRIEISQRDEIALMRQWLAERHQHVPNPDDTAHAMAMPGMTMDHAAMPGMLTPAELTRLAGAHGDAFDRLFLEDMIRHHQGALRMVADLLATNGAAQAPEVFQFAADVDTDQRSEILRMQALLDSLPRVPSDD